MMMKNHHQAYSLAKYWKVISREAMHTKHVIYSRQHYFKLLSDFFDPQSSQLAKPGSVVIPTEVQGSKVKCK